MSDDAADTSSAARWRAGDAILAFISALLLAAFGGAVLSIASGSGDGDALTPAAAQLGTLWQHAMFILVPLALASRLARPTLADFGVVGLPTRRLLLWAVGAFGAFVAFSSGWDALVGADGAQNTLSRLGADEAGVLRLTAALLVIAVAPVAEEVLFRGFMYRGLRNSVGPWVAAVAVGAIFGLIHLTDADTAPLVPLLAVLGALMCVLYERTGSLAAPIALHVLNNTLAFSLADDVPDAAAIGIPIGIVTLAAVVLLSARSRASGAPSP